MQKTFPLNTPFGLLVPTRRLFKTATAQLLIEQMGLSMAKANKLSLFLILTISLSADIASITVIKPHEITVITSCALTKKELCSGNVNEIQFRWTSLNCRTRG